MHERWPVFERRHIFQSRIHTHNWIPVTHRPHRSFARIAILAGLGLSAACGGGGTPPKTVGAPAALNTSATTISAFANMDVATPIVVTVVDANSNPVPNQQVTFAVTAGGGSLTGNATVTSDANGQVTAPTWKFGKSAIAQTLTATLGTITKTIQGAVTTNYLIDVRFFGRTMTAAEQALFTGAAQRIMGVITGDVPNVTGTMDMSGCGVNQTLNETFDDIVVFASVDTIDGPGKILGQSGPCYVRNPGSHQTISAVMKFDKDDFGTFLTAVYGQDVITHEMLHAVGVGTLWELGPPFTPETHLLSGAGTADPRYTGTEGRLGCVAIGGTITCASTVPVEGNSEAVGTRDAHWRDHSPGATFGAELMTGYVNNSANPFSLLTIRSLTDLGYTVNANDFDAFTIPGGVLRASASIEPTFDIAAHERLTYPKYAMDRNGKVTKLPERK